MPNGKRSRDADLRAGRAALVVVAVVRIHRPRALSPIVGIGAARARAYRRDVTQARQTLGRGAEEAAAAYLTRAGFRVVERNVRLGHGEIDLVCRDDDVVVFVEVKCRRTTWGDPPAAAVSWHKQRRLTRLAQHYLKWRRLDGVRCRFDVVSVTLDAAGRSAIAHVRNAFDAVQ